MIPGDICSDGFTFFPILPTDVALNPGGVGQIRYFLIGRKTMNKVLLVLLFIALVCTPAFAMLKVVGKGDSTSLDSSGFPPALKTSWGIMKVKCVKCHTMERTVVALTTGIAPITGQPFDRNAIRTYGVKMLRKPDSNMNKSEVKLSVDLMNFLLDIAEK
jgi:hypothetical protein